MELAPTEAGKRLCRLTKAEMVSRIGWCFGITLAFVDLRQQYDYLKATMDLLRGESTALREVIKDIEAAYEEAAEENFFSWGSGVKKLEKLFEALPDRIWIE